MDRNRPIYLDFRDVQRGIFGMHAYLQLQILLIGSLALSSVDRSFGSHDFHLRSTI